MAHKPPCGNTTAHTTHRSREGEKGTERSREGERGREREREREGGGGGGGKEGQRERREIVDTVFLTLT